MCEVFRCITSCYSSIRCSFLPCHSVMSSWDKVVPMWRKVCVPHWVIVTLVAHKTREREETPQSGGTVFRTRQKVVPERLTGQLCLLGWHHPLMLHFTDSICWCRRAVLPVGTETDAVHWTTVSIQDLWLAGRLLVHDPLQHIIRLFVN